MIKGQYTITTIKFMDIDPYGNGGAHAYRVAEKIMNLLKKEGFSLFNFSLPIPKKWMGEPANLFTCSSTLHRAPRCKNPSCNPKVWPCPKCGNCTCYSCIPGGGFPTCEA